MWPKVNDKVTSLNIYSMGLYMHIASITCLTQCKISTTIKFTGQDKLQNVILVSHSLISGTRKIYVTNLEKSSQDKDMIISDCTLKAYYQKV